jgi:hypothetical protein
VILFPEIKNSMDTKVSEPVIDKKTLRKAALNRVIPGYSNQL